MADDNPPKTEDEESDEDSDEDVEDKAGDQEGAGDTDEDEGKGAAAARLHEMRDRDLRPAAMSKKMAAKHRAVVNGSARFMMNRDGVRFISACARNTAEFINRDRAVDRNGLEDGGPMVSFL